MAGRDISVVELEGSSSWLAEGPRGRQESGPRLAVWRQMAQQTERH